MSYGCAVRRRLLRIALVWGFATTTGLGSAGATAANSEGATIEPIVTTDADTGSIPTWREAKVVLTVDPTFMALPYAAQALEGAVWAWTSACSELPAIELAFAMTEGSPVDAEASATDHRITYAPEGNVQAGKALAITLVTLDSDARILDADIIVNGGHRFTDSTLDSQAEHGSGSSYDLQNVLTHELGHWLGLGEDYDNPEATMYAYVNPGEIKKRDLDADDVYLVQVAYWQADNPSGESSGCAVRGPGSQRNWTLIGYLAAALFWLRRANQRDKPQFALGLRRHLHEPTRDR